MLRRSGAGHRQTGRAKATSRRIWRSSRAPPSTPCAGGDQVSGPFYCPETGTAAFDLTFLAALGGRLKRQEDLGLALVAARMSAEHLQRELGLLDAAALRLIGARRGRRAVVGAALALQADCLTGVWAAAASHRLGPVPAALLRPAGLVLAQRGRRPRQQGIRVPAEFDPLAPRHPGRAAGSLRPRLCGRRASPAARRRRSSRGAEPKRRRRPGMNPQV